LPDELKHIVDSEKILTQIGRGIVSAAIVVII